MQNTDIQSNTDKLEIFIAQKFESGQLNNDSLVQIIELCGAYLNLQSISAYAKENGKTYNGVKNHRTIIILFGNKFVLDNE